jgi:hypothetical protein
VGRPVSAPRSTIRRAGGVAGALAVLALALLPTTAAAATPVTFGTPTATSSWGLGVTFRQPVTAGGPLARAEILLDEPGLDGPIVSSVGPFAAGSRTLSYVLDASAGGVYPNTVITARWRVWSADGTAQVGPATTVRYDDTRFDWQTISGSIVDVHWVEGARSFGQRALAIAEDAVASASSLLGITETDRIDFFIYPDRASFYDAMGPGIRENVGGTALPEIRTLFAWIPAGAFNEALVRDYVPHELTHLVFDTAVRNPYHEPPRWLNEGLAVYLSQSYGASDQRSVQAAVADGSLMPLSALTAQFPTTRERFNLAYAESVAAIDFLVRQYGQDALVQLVRSYATGITDDEAFRQALGLGIDEFDAAWRASVGAATPVALGPQPAPTGPIPSDWLAAAPSPAASGTPIPGATASTGPTPGPEPGGGSSASDGGAAAALAALVVVLLGLVAAAAILRRRRVRGVLVVRPPAPPIEPIEPAAGEDSAATEGTTAQADRAGPGAGDDAS